MNKRKLLVATILTAFFLAGFAGLAETKQVADVMIGANGINWQPKVSYNKLKLTVQTPLGAVITKTFESGAFPYFDFSDTNGVAMVDGSYTYELRVIPNIAKKIRKESDEKTGSSWLDRSNDIPRQALVQSGHFSIEGGSIVTLGAPEREAINGGISVPANGGISQPLDQVILDDLIVDGSLCVGIDCVNGENFGFDTIRLKENNLRIKFQDTSASASFPTNDWEITINDSANGGASYFAVQDVDGGKVPFKVTAGAGSNSLFINSSGNIGFGTATPVVDLHVLSGNTPTLRLDQDGSSGFTPQVWDVAGNEANFFVRDVTNGSKLPFKIKPGAPTDSLYLAANGDVGIGTASPDSKLNVEGSGSAVKFILTKADSSVSAEIIAKSGNTTFGSKTDHPVQFSVNSSTRMTLNEISNAQILTMSDGGNYNGTWNNASSRALKENIHVLDVDEAIDTLEGLEPVRYNYKVDKEEEHVGFIAEEVPDLVANTNRKSLSSMDIVAVLTKVVKEQQKTITELKNKVAEIEKTSQSKKK